MDFSEKKDAPTRFFQQKKPKNLFKTFSKPLEVLRIFLDLLAFRGILHPGQ